MKRVILAVALVAIVSSAACQKKEERQAAPTPAPTEPTPAPAEPAEPADLELDGTPSENLVTVFTATVDELKTASSAEDAAKILDDTLKKYDVAELRAKSRAAKEAGQRATEETKAKLKSAKERYGELAAKFSKDDAATFGPAAKAWAAAWGLN